MSGERERKESSIYIGEKKTEKKTNEGIHQLHNSSSQSLLLSHTEEEEERRKKKEEEEANASREQGSGPSEARVGEDTGSTSYFYCILIFVVLFSLSVFYSRVRLSLSLSFSLSFFYVSMFTKKMQRDRKRRSLSERILKCV